MKFNFNNNFTHYLKVAIGGLLTFSLVVQTAFFANIGAANAATIGSITDRATNTVGKAIENVKEIALRDDSDNRALDNGIRDEDRNGKNLIDRAQAQVNKVKAEADDNEYRNRGKARAAIEDAKDDVRNTASSVADKVTSAADDATNSLNKNLNKAGNKAAKIGNRSEEASENVIDAVKDFFSGDRK